MPTPNNIFIAYYHRGCDLQKLLESIDTDHDGQVTLQEIMDYCKGGQSFLDMNKITNAFKQQGKETVGKMSINELIATITTP